MSTLFDYMPHPHLERKRSQGPPTVASAAEQVHGTSTMGRFNAALGVGITNSVGTMWTAYIFTVLALLSLPAVLSGFHAFHSVFPNWMIRASIIALIAWVAQTFLQLVLLPIIIVGQNVQAAAADNRSQATYDDACAILEEAKQIQKHLEAQDAAIEKILGGLGGAPIPR
jgi:hypothetical protein